MASLERHILLAFLATLALAWGAAPLQWEDCGLLSDTPLLRLLNYSHVPDPIAVGRNATIAKRWHYTGKRPLTALTEAVVIDRVLANESGSWQSYFNNSFDMCLRRGLCPIAPGSVFDIVDNHPPSHSPPARFRAVERFYAGGESIGCAAVVYAET